MKYKMIIAGFISAFMVFSANARETTGSSSDELFFAQSGSTKSGQKSTNTTTTPQSQSGSQSMVIRGTVVSLASIVSGAVDNTGSGSSGFNSGSGTTGSTPGSGSSGSMGSGTGSSGTGSGSTGTTGSGSGTTGSGTSGTTGSGSGSTGSGSMGSSGTMDETRRGTMSPGTGTTGSAYTAANGYAYGFMVGSGSDANVYLVFHPDGTLASDALASYSGTGEVSIRGTMRNINGMNVIVLDNAQTPTNEK